MDKKLSMIKRIPISNFYLKKQKQYSTIITKTYPNKSSHTKTFQKYDFLLNTEPPSFKCQISKNLIKYPKKNFNHVNSQNNSDLSNNLKKIRGLLDERNYDAYILPRTDSHDNEYLSSVDERVAFLSGFTGSNATALITQEEAFLWTDGRYYFQAEKELNSEWTLMKMEKNEMTLAQYIEKILYTKFKDNDKDKKIRIGIDTNLITHEKFKRLTSSWEKLDIEVIAEQNNLVDVIRDPKSLEYSEAPVILHNIEFCGKAPIQKFKETFDFIESKYINADFYSEIKAKQSSLGLIITRLDDIAWLTNLRGNDIEFNPLFFSFAILFKDFSNTNSFRLVLYSNKNKFQHEKILTHLKGNYIELKEYKSFMTDLEKLKENLLCDKNSLNQSTYQKLIANKKDTFHILNENPVQHLKSRKNETEIKSLKEANKRDGLCLIRFYCWLEKRLLDCSKDNKISSPTEFECTEKLVEFRKRGSNYMGESFAAISATGGNGAIIHYRPDKKNSAAIDINKIYLLDSGAQYLDGTTDITRALYFGENPTKFEKEMYTRVLLGNLSLERCKFRKDANLSGASFDPIARQFLWHESKDYLHGTGHGLGFFLNVHEGPQSISNRNNEVSLKRGMVVTNEPGFYLKDNFGIRIENNLLVSENDQDLNYYCFHNLTLVPYESKLIDLDLVSNEMLEYINKYHEKIRSVIEPLLNESEEDSLAKDYLIRKTKKIEL